MSESLPIQPIQPPSGSEGIGKKSASKPDGPSFGDVLKNSILEVNQLQKDADFAIEQLQTGKTEKVSEVLTAVEKADLAFRALMQIRNKLVDAYEEVNRLRV
ncbi:MAG: flagellar hook-basal body complex protein FliE [Planctomycetota bacterium]